MKAENDSNQVGLSVEMDFGDVGFTGKIDRLVVLRHKDKHKGYPGDFIFSTFFPCMVMPVNKDGKGTCLDLSCEGL